MDDAALPPGDHTGDPAGSVTLLLTDPHIDREEAWDRVYGLLYDDLRRVARAQIRQRAFGRMSATSLISEGWLRLNGARLHIDDRRHFIALVARAMRFVLMDEVRRDMTEKRGEGRRDASVEEADPAAPDAALEDMIALDAALDRLAQVDTRLARLVEMRYFGGMEEPEIAAALGVTDRTLRRDWRRARAFLLTQLGDSGACLDAS